MLGIDAYWQITFAIMSIFIISSNIGLIFIPEIGTNERLSAQKLAQDSIRQKMGGASVINDTLSYLVSTIIIPFSSFFRNNGLKIGLGLLSFIFLFKIGEAFIGRMSIVFYKEVGFSKSDIAIYSKGLGWLVTVFSSLAGGYFAIRVGLVRSQAGLFMASTNLLFSVLAWLGNVDWLFAMSVVLDDLAAAISTVIFVAFISLLVDRNYTATQYALLASIGTLGRTLFASSSGALVDGLDGDWGLFFIITALMVIPSLLLLWSLRNRLPINSHNQ